jgi:hypothetical protein
MHPWWIFLCFPNRLPWFTILRIVGLNLFKEMQWKSWKFKTFRQDDEHFWLCWLENCNMAGEHICSTGIFFSSSLRKLYFYPNCMSSPENWVPDNTDFTVQGWVINPLTVWWTWSPSIQHCLWSTLASYSGGPRFKSQTRDQLSWLGSCGFSSVLSGNCQDSTKNRLCSFPYTVFFFKSLSINQPWHYITWTLKSELNKS